MPDSDMILGIKLSFVLFFMSFVLDVVSWRHGKKAMHHDISALPSGVKWVSKSYLFGRIQYYLMMPFCIPMTIFSLYATYASVVFKDKVVWFILFICFLSLVFLLIRMMLCINMSWICYDKVMMYWRRWSEKKFSTYELRNIINHRLTSGVVVHFLYLADGRVLNFYNLNSSLEDMCNKSEMLRGG